MNKILKYQLGELDSDESISLKKGKFQGFADQSLIDLDKGAVKLLKVAPFTRYPEHMHYNKTEYAYVVQGKPEVTIRKRRFLGKEGDFFIFPKDVNHSIENNQKTECVLIIGSIIN